MASQRQDYILRLISELQQFVSAIIASGDPGKREEAVHAVMHAQQQLFQRPLTEIMGMTLDEQIAALSQGEPPAGAVEKIGNYAAILEQVARVYEGTDRTSLAVGSRQLALAALATASARWPEQRGGIAAQLAALRARVSPEDINPVVQALLDRHEAAR